MSARKKKKGEIYAWQRRAAPIYIHVILEPKREVVRYVISTKDKILE